MAGHKTTGGKWNRNNSHILQSYIPLCAVNAEICEQGEDPFFTLQAVLDDQSSSRGTERVTLFDVNFDSAKISRPEVVSEALEEEVPFTFKDLDLPEKLNETF